MKKIYNFTHYILPALLITITTVGCEKNDDAIDTKGGKSALVQNIAANTDYIQSIESEATYNLCNGVEITDITCTYMLQPTRLIVAVVDLNKNVTVAASSPGNKTSGISTLESVPEQAMSAENAGMNVWLAINGGNFNGTQAAGLFYKDGIAIKESADPGEDNCVVVTRDGKVRICSVSDFLVLKNKLYTPSAERNGSWKTVNSEPSWPTTARWNYKPEPSWGPMPTPQNSTSSSSREAPPSNLPVSG